MSYNPKQTDFKSDIMKNIAVLDPRYIQCMQKK